MSLKSLKREIQRQVIPWKRNSGTFHGACTRYLREPYIVINLVFAGVIMLIIAYSGIFSAEKSNHPVVCIHEKITGEQCVSCGLSRSFSLIVRGRFAEATEWNKYGLRIFLFFALQLLMRVVFSLFSIKLPGARQKLICYDIGGSAVLFLLAFWPFIRWLALVLVAR